LRRSLVARGLVFGLLALLILPSGALAQDSLNLNEAVPKVIDELNTTWVIVAGCLVMFMQAGFAFLEIGFVRGKNAGSVIAKILTNFSISAIVWWIAGFAIAFGGAAKLVGDSGFFLGYGDKISGGIVEGPLSGNGAAFFFFQFVFCAVSLAIVWGTR
jgi:ammonium transporter, Amt family